MTAVNPDGFVPAFPQFVEDESVRAAERIVNPYTDQNEQEHTGPNPGELGATVGFLRRIGKTAINLPHEANYALQRLYVNFQNDPVGTSKVAGEIGIVGTEVTPLNESFRYIPAVAVQAYTGNSLAGGLTLTALTAIIEGSAVYATADLMQTGAGKKVFEWLHRKTQKVLKGRKVTNNPAVEMAVTYAGGAGVIMAAKKMENPDMTHEEIVREGKFAVGWLAPLLGVQWVTGANAIQNPTPANLALGLGTTVGAYAGAKVAQKRSKNKKPKEAK